MGWMDSLNAAARGPTKGLSLEERRKIASDVVTMSSMGAAAVTFAPIPGSDFLLVTPVQASMVMGVGRIFGRELELSEARDILMELASVCGLALLAQKGFATLSKIILPGLGGLLAGPYAFAVTYGMGRAAMSYFEDREATRETLKRVFEDAVAEGKRIFSREKLDEFRKKRGQEVTDFAREAVQGKEPAEEPKAKRAAKPKATAKKRPAAKKPKPKAKRKAAR